MTKIYILKNETNDFDDFLTDPTVKKYVEGKISYDDHMIVLMDENIAEDIKSYIILKYGDMIKDLDYMVVDRSPVMFEDYWPEEENKFTKYIYENKRNTQRRKV